MKSFCYKFLLPLSSLLVLTAAWQTASGHYSPALLPPPADVIKALTETSDSGILWKNIAVSLLRFFTAYIMAVACAVPLGIILGYHPMFRRAIDPMVQILRPISPIAWFPLAVLWFGIGSAPAIFVIFMAAFYPVLLSTIDAVRQVPPLYHKVASNFGAGRFAVFSRVIIPAAFPGIMVGLHIAVGTAWIHVVAGEMLGAQSGLGYMIVDARNFMRTDLIIAGMLVIGVLGLIIYSGMRALESMIKKMWGADNI